MLSTTKGIVLRKINYQNSSLIVTVLTRQHGKIALLAKAAKKPKSAFGGKLHVGNLVELVFYYKETRSVQILKEVNLTFKTFENQTILEKVALTMMTCELADQLVHDGEINEPVRQFLAQFLVWLNQTDKNPAYIFAYNQIRLADIMGIGLTWIYNDVNVLEREAYLNVQEGTLSARPRTNNSIKLSYNQTIYVKQALKSKSTAILNANFKNNEYRNLIKQLDTYFQYHFDGIRRRKSDAIFEQVM